GQGQGDVLQVVLAGSVDLEPCSLAHPAGPPEVELYRAAAILGRPSRGSCRRVAARAALRRPNRGSRDGNRPTRLTARPAAPTIKNASHFQTGRSLVPVARAPSDLASVRASLAGRGLRLTDQRRLILAVVQETDRHPTAEWVHAAVRRRRPRVSLATVYRNLRLLA